MGKRSNNCQFHARYLKSNTGFECPWCYISIPNILALPFKIIPSDGVGTFSFIGSKKIFSSLQNRDYKIMYL